MAIKATTEKEQKEHEEYPKLMVRIDPDLTYIVLFSESKCGTVVFNGQLSELSLSRAIGYHSRTWNNGKL